MLSCREALIDEVKRRLLESQERLVRCLHWLDLEQIWYRPNEQTNSVGNLVLHLHGNARQWLFTTFAGQTDRRRRDEEFKTNAHRTKEELNTLLDNLFADIESLMERIDEEALVKHYRVQGFEESGVGILIHVVEHFSYHVGQITYVVKWLHNMDTGYYRGVDLNRQG